MTTETYQHFATVLNQLLGNDRAVRLTVSGYMPLSVEDIGTSQEGNRLISICHYGEQNGDLMRDPDMVFEVYAAINAAEPLSYRNDYMGIMQEVYTYNDAGRKPIGDHISKMISPHSPKRGLKLSTIRVSWARRQSGTGSPEPVSDRATCHAESGAALTHLIRLNTHAGVTPFRGKGDWPRSFGIF